MSVCACLGPAGDCPCIRRSRGEKVEIYRSYVNDTILSYLTKQELEIHDGLESWGWDNLTDEQKIHLNWLKQKAVWDALFDNKPIPKE